MKYPSDFNTAYEEWGANCGPCSLAAMLDVPVALVRPYFSAFDTLGYVNPTHMLAALNRAGVAHFSVGKARPNYGLCFVQWGGHDKRPVAAQYRYTHWIGVSSLPCHAIDPATGAAVAVETSACVYEVNAPHLVSWEDWADVMPKSVMEDGRGDGTFFIRMGIEIDPMNFSVV